MHVFIKCGTINETQDCFFSADDEGILGVQANSKSQVIAGWKLDVYGHIEYVIFCWKIWCFTDTVFYDSDSWATLELQGQK
jgi:hypothetical protein